jgi:Flp pilus assembly protein TadD
MSSKALLMVSIFSSLGLVAFIGNTLKLARRRYLRRYELKEVASKQSFIRYWLKKYRLSLSIAIGCYLILVGTTAYLGSLRYRAPKTKQYAANLQNKAEQQKQLWKEYVELSSAAETDTENAELLLKLAQMQRNLGLGRKALATYQKVLYLDSSSLTATYELGCLAAILGETSLARNQVNSLSSRWPTMPEQHLLQAVIAFRSGNPSQAREQWRAALAKDPSNQEARNLLITTYLKQHLYADAAQLAQAGLSLDPSDTDLHLKLAESLVGLGRVADAQTTLRVAVELDSTSPAPVLMMGELQVLQHDYLSAIKSYEEVLKRSPDHVLAMNNIAQLTADHGYEYERAATLASRMYAKFPNDPAVADTLGWVLFKQGKLYQGLPLLMFASASAPNNPAHRYHLGAALIKNGQIATGRKELEAALKLSKDFDGASQARILLAEYRL